MASELKYWKYGLPKVSVDDANQDAGSLKYWKSGLSWGRYKSAGVTQKNVSDSGAGSDAILSLKAILSLIESGSGADQITVDTGVTPKQVNDVGAGADAISVLSKLILQETGSGADAIDILRKLLLLETGSGADILELIVKFALAETGAGADVVSKSGVTQKVVSDQNQPNITYF